MLHVPESAADMASPSHPDVEWSRKELSEVANTLARVHERTASTILSIEEENEALRKRVYQLENSSGEIRRLRAENARLAAKLAAAVPEREELVRERDASLRKLQNLRKVVSDLLSEGRGGPDFALAEEALHDDEAGSTTAVSSTVRADNAGRSDSGASEHTNGVATINAGQAPRRPSAPPVSHTSSILHPSSKAGPSTPALGAPFTDSRSTSSARVAFSQPFPRVLSAANLGGSPVRRAPSGARSMSLNLSPGMSDGLSVQYEDMHSSASASTGARAKWRIHFAKPPTTAKTVVGPVPFADLVEKLNLDEDTIVALDGMEGLPSDSLRLHIARNSAFLYDPVLLESPSAPYIVDWGRSKVIKNISTYITGASGQYDSLHTYMYSTKKTGWYYLGLQKWTTASVKPIWPMLATPAQRALAARRAGTISAADIARMLSNGELVQLAVELRATPGGTDEVKVLRRLRDR